MKKLAILTSCLALVFTSNMANASTSLRFGYEAPRSDTQHIAAKKFNQLLKEKTKGDFKLSLFPDSTLGNALTMIGAVRGGTIDLEMSGSSNFSGIEPSMSVIDIPFIFKDKEHAYRVLDGEVGDSLLKKLESKGLKGLAFWEVGFRSITNSKKPITSKNDIKGLKIRTNQNPMYVKTFELLGANPVPMPLSELYTALETRAVDAQEHPLGIVWSTKLYEVQKYLTITNHGYSPLIVIMNKDKYDSLPSNIQQALVSAAKEAGQYQRKLNAKNEGTILAKMKENGLKVIEKIDMKPFADTVESEVRQYFIKDNGDELVKQIDALAK